MSKYTDAIKIITEQRLRFLEGWSDSGNVDEAYDLAIEVLKNEERRMQVQKKRWENDKRKSD